MFATPTLSMECTRDYDAVIKAARGNDRVGLAVIVNLHRTVEITDEMRLDLVRMAHAIIREAETPPQLGYSWRCEVNVMGTGHPEEYVQNPYNEALTRKIKDFDEGVYCHMLNRIAYLIRGEKLARRDYLGIMDYDDDWHEGWVHVKWCRFNRMGERMDSDAVENAHKLYGHVMNGDC